MNMENMKQYKLYGTAKGVLDGEFSMDFVASGQAETPKIAMDNVRSGMYDMGYDDILFEKVEEKINDYDFVEIPMMQALELE
jgi:hypothetical protein